MILKLRGARARSLCTLSCRWRNPVSMESQQIHVFVCSARRGLFGGSRARNSTPEGGTDASSSVWRKKFEGSCVMQDLYFAASVSPPLLAVLQCQYPALPLPLFFPLHPQRPFFSCVVTRAPLSLWVGKQQMLKTSGIIITIKSTIRPKAQHEIVSPNKNHFVILRLHVVHCLHVPSLVYCDSSPHTPSWCHECSPEHQTWINLLLKIVPNKHRDYFPWENHQHAAVLWTFGIFLEALQ